MSGAPDIRIRRLAEISADIMRSVDDCVNYDPVTLIEELDRAIVYAAGQYDGLLAAVKQSAAAFNEDPETDAQFLKDHAEWLDRADEMTAVCDHELAHDDAAGRLRRIADRLAS